MGTFHICKAVTLVVEEDRITEWVGLEGTLTIIQFNPSAMGRDRGCSRGTQNLEVRRAGEGEIPTGIPMGYTANTIR